MSRVPPGRFAGLEAYRGLAALLIVIYHVYQFGRVGEDHYPYEGLPVHLLLRNLEAGVACFFVLSGFVIFLPLARAALGAQPAPAVRGFLLRRAIRIVPAYYLAIALVWALRFSGFPGQWPDLLEHLTFTHVFDSAHIFWTIGPAWSLGVEMVFYLLVALVGPPACRLAGRLGSARARTPLLGGGVLALFLLSAAYKGWAAMVAGIPEQDYAVWFGPLAKLDEFALGMGLAVVLAATGDRLRLVGPAPSLLRLAGLALLGAAIGLRFADMWVGLFFHTLAGLAFALVLAGDVLGLRRPAGAWQRALSHPALHGLGLVSYSVYLWHEPILLELGKAGVLLAGRPDLFVPNAVVLVALSVAAGIVSYWGIERPALLLRELFTPDGRLAARYEPGPAIRMSRAGAQST